MADRISVIVPVYNLEAYIESCLQSLQAQTYPDWEAVCVDDGSTDGSGAIIRAMAEKDARIIYVRQENAGVSAARNTGLAACKGDYVTFLDGDDMLHPQCLALLLDAIADYDVSSCDYCKVSEREIDYPSYPMTPDCIPLDLDAFYNLKSSDDANLLSKAAVAKLYRRSFALTFTFPVGVFYSEDMHFIGKILTLHPRICYVNLPLYYYYNRPSSIIHSEFTEKKFTCTQTLDELCDYLKSKNETYLLGQTMRCLYAALICIRTDSIGTPFRKRAFRDCRRKGGKWLGAWLRNPHISLKMRLTYFVFFLSERGYELGRIHLDPSMREVYRAQRRRSRK